MFKKVSKLLSIFILLYYSTNAQITIVPSNTQDRLNSIVQIGNTTLVTTYYNYVLKSDDDFDTFSILPLPSSFNYSGKVLKYQHNKLYLMAGTLGPTNMEYWVSTDTGNNWTLLYDTTNVFVQDFHMFDTLNGVIYASQHRKLRTIDGGHNWQVEYTINSVPYWILMYNDSIGVIPTQEKILLTSNRFITEVFQSNSEMSGATDGQYLNKDTLIFTSCVNVSGCYLLYSHNGGTLWQKKLTNSFSPRGLYFFNYNEGYVVGRGYILGVAPMQGMIKKTTDMGVTWTIYTTGIDCELNDIVFLNDSIALISGTNGVLLKWNKNSAVTSVIDAGYNSELSLYPNPSSEEHTLSLTINNLNELPKCQLMDISGRILNTYTMESKGQQQYTLINDVSTLLNGLYYYKVWTGDRTYSIRFIVAH